jgi:ubiquinone/menaquinone biosynthesis C-methylase UbiE
MQKLIHWFKLALAGVFWLTVFGRWRIRDVFNDVYQGQAQSETFRRILHEVFGEQHAVEADPTGFLTLNDLNAFVTHLKIGKEQKLADLACGRGGAGLWVARATGASLVGVDISDIAVRQAAQRAGEFGLAGRAEFCAGDFAATGLPSEAFEAVMSVDALFLVADKEASVAETARILKRGGRFACTTWEMDEQGGVKDYRPLLEHAGFRVDYYEATPNWEAYQRGVHERVLARQDDLIREMGKAGANFWIQGAKIELNRLTRMRRVFFAATRL